MAGKFIPMLNDRIRKLQLGDPMDGNTEVGPLCSVEQAETVYEQVVRSISGGAMLIPEEAVMMPSSNPPFFLTLCRACRYLTRKYLALCFP